MISSALQQKFKIIETAAFPVWQKASKKQKEIIAKRLGEYEAKEIMKEIEEEVNKIKFKKNSICHVYER